MKKINSFEVVYRNMVAYTLGSIVGSFVDDQKKVDRGSLEFKRLLYANFKQSVITSLGYSTVDRNIWVVNQNELKNVRERDTLKELCRTYYYNSDVY